MTKKLIYQDSDSFAEISTYGQGQFCITQKIFGNRSDECVVLTIEELEKALELAYELQKPEGKKNETLRTYR